MRLSGGGPCGVCRNEPGVISSRILEGAPRRVMGVDGSRWPGFGRTSSMVRHQPMTPHTVRNVSVVGGGEVSGWVRPSVGSTKVSLRVQQFERRLCLLRDDPVPQRPKLSVAGDRGVGDPPLGKAKHPFDSARVKPTVRRRVWRATTNHHHPSGYCWSKPAPCMAASRFSRSSFQCSFR